MLLGTTPIITELTRNTILPVQPGLTWDPCQPLPWDLYNTPALFGNDGLVDCDKFYGLNTWPPVYLTDPITGTSTSIMLLPGYSLAYLPTKLTYFEVTIDFANLL